MDGSGLFRLVANGNGWQIRTVRSVSNLAAHYGAYPINIVVDGWQFPTTLYITDGS
jgi:hypothetical protein